MCHVFEVTEELNDIRLCIYCIENCDTSDLISTIQGICEQVLRIGKENCNLQVLPLYENVSKAIKNICTDEQFTRIQAFLKKESTSLETAIGNLKSIYMFNGGLYFTANQAKTLVKKHWSFDIGKWHNILVFMCLDIDQLDTNEFTCGMCYFGNFGEEFTSPFALTKYLNERGFDIDMPSFW